MQIKLAHPAVRLPIFKMPISMAAVLSCLVLSGLVWGVLQFNPPDSTLTSVETFKTTFPGLNDYFKTTTGLEVSSRVQNGQKFKGYTLQSTPFQPVETSQATETKSQDNKLKLFLPESYQESFVISGAQTQVDLQALGGKNAIAHSDNNTLIYPGIFPETDSLELVQETESKEFLLLHNATAPQRFEYLLTTSPGTEVRLVDGRVQIRDKTGQGLEIAKPWLMAASGVEYQSPDVIHWDISNEANGQYKLALVLNSSSLPFPQAVDPSWTLTGVMHSPRIDHNSILLNNGKVLILGGGIASSELYDQITGTFSLTGAMTTGRSFNTATLLADGRVLVTGGGTITTLASAEIYNPATGLFSLTGNMNSPRVYHSAVLLQSGKVLITGGTNSTGDLNTSEIYDPATGLFTPVANFNAKRTRHTATLLQNGKVLIAGGNYQYGEIYDPTTNSFSLTGYLGSNRFGSSATLLQNGKVLITGGNDGSFSNEYRYSSTILYDPVTGNFNFGGTMSSPRDPAAATLLPDGKVLVVGSDVTSDLYDPGANGGAGAWYLSSRMSTPRTDTSAVLLSNGKVMVSGGLGYSTSDILASAEIYDPSTSNWFGTGSMNSSRAGHSATLLQTGKVLIAGGMSNSNTILSSAELYDPSTGTFSPTGSLNTLRYNHTATLLTNGKVLITGGTNSNWAINNAELYDPLTGLFTPLGNLNQVRTNHSALLLASGKVLIIGGENQAHQVLASVESFDPATNLFTSVASLNLARSAFGASLLPNGQIIVTGGQAAMGNSGAALKSAELYDSTANGGAGLWTLTGDMANQRSALTATLLPDGKVLIAGGKQDSSSANTLSSTELYDPLLGTFSPGGNMATPRNSSVAVLLPDGKVLLAGGLNSSATIASTELYDPTTKTFSSAGNMSIPRSGERGLILPDSKVLIIGGISNGQPANSAELFDYSLGSFTKAANFGYYRYSHAALLLPSGKVLMVGGGTYGQYITPVALTEIYEPATNSWRYTAPMSYARIDPSTTLLPDGKIIVAGGSDTASVEMYNPLTETWTPLADMPGPRAGHSAVLLPNGKILVIGGVSPNLTYLSSALLYDPITNVWTPTGSMSVSRKYSSATLLPDGKVLVVGGYINNYEDGTNTTEIYDPATGTFSLTGQLAGPFTAHTATLLPNGKVLAVNWSYAELFDPGTGTWLRIKDTLSQHFGAFTATLLPNGKVLLCGGDYYNAVTELFDPETGLWLPGPNLPEPHWGHAATLLPNGKVLITGGYSAWNVINNSTEIFDPGINFSPNWQPQISSATSPLIANSALVLNGSHFQGISEASNSATNYPVVQLYSLVNGQTRWLPTNPNTRWSGSVITTTALTNFPAGFALATVFVNGIPSQSQIIQTDSYFVLLNSAPNPSFVGDTVTFTATVSSNLAIPTGTITFKEGSNILFSGSLGSNGLVTFTTSILSLGTHSLIAEYSGDTNFTAGNSPVLLHRVLCSYSITSALDNGSATSCGTLSFALVQAASSTTPVTITLPSLITFSGPMPVVTSTYGISITIAGSCSVNNNRGLPGSQIVAGVGASSDSLTLTNNMSITGVKIGWFSGYALRISGNNTAVNCSWLGTFDGTTPAPNGGGIMINGSNTKLGTSGNPLTGNLISGNMGLGVLIAAGSKNNEAYYNWVGLKSNGSRGLKNGGGGVKVQSGGQMKFGLGNRLAN